MFWNDKRFLQIVANYIEIFTKELSQNFSNKQKFSDNSFVLQTEIFIKTP